MSVSTVIAERHHIYRESIAEGEHSTIEADEIRRLLATLEPRDGYSGEHSRAVMGLAAEVGRWMGLPEEEEVAVVQQAAFVHDVGKVAIPDSILRKRGPLNAAEVQTMQEHAALGAIMVDSIPGLAHLASVIRAKHERWDGEGYPDGLRGEEIPLASRIIHACDAWHAMASDSPYRKPLGVESWIRKFEENVGKQFDPRVVLALVEVLKTRYLLPGGFGVPSARPST